MKSKTNKHPGRTPSAIGSAITKSGLIGLALMLAPAANAQRLKISPAIIYQGDSPQITASSCPEPNSWVYVYHEDAPSNNLYALAGGRCIAGNPLSSSRMTFLLGEHEIRLLGRNGKVYERLTYTVRPPILRGCRDVTSQATYTPGNLAVTLPSWLPLALRQQIANSMRSGGAYMQLKGNWCFNDGPNKNRVISRSIQPLQAAITGNGFNGLFFKIKPVATGAVSLIPTSNVGDVNKHTNYRISQSKAEVYLYAPFALSLPVPGTSGQVVNIPAGTQWKVYDLVLDTVLSGQGNASCAGTQYGPCKIHYLGPITPF
jgi:hypothetical protein